MRLIYIILSLTVVAYCNDISIKAWVDIPNEISLQEHNDEFVTINNLIKEYHNVDKESVENLSKRILMLLEINKKVLLLLGNNKKTVINKILTDFSIILKKRIWYINQLIGIYKNNIDTFESIFKYHTDTVAQCCKYKPLFLVNKLLYDSKLPGYWGLYWLETIDPCHRQLMSYFLSWTNSNKKNSVPFFMWLENQNLPYYVPQVKFFDQLELDKCKIKIKNGIIVDANYIPLTYDDESEYIFIISISNELFVTKSSQFIHHTSLSNGRPVLASGSIKIKNGEIVYLDMESGHYQPTMPYAFQTIKILKDMNVKFNSNCIIAYYNAGRIVNSNINECNNIDLLDIEYVKHDPYLLNLK